MLRVETLVVSVIKFVCVLCLFLCSLIDFHWDSALVAEDLWSVVEIDTVEPLVMRKSVAFNFISFTQFFFMILYLGRYG